MKFPIIYTSTQMMDLINQIGFLPLLDSGIPGFAAEDIVAEECRYYTDPDEGFVWPLWQWKGEIVKETGCLYGKIFNRKAGFVSRQWIADLCNYRRSKYPYPANDTIEGAILDTLRMTGSQITRQLRFACGFDGPKMRSKFDSYLTRLEMATYIVTQDFVYPHDKHNRQYGWGWSLLNTPEELFGRDTMQCDHTPQQSYQLICHHLRTILPNATDRQIQKLIG